jgi:hypothetical protein
MLGVDSVQTLSTLTYLCMKKDYNYATTCGFLVSGKIDRDAVTNLRSVTSDISMYLCKGRSPSRISSQNM